MERNTTTTALVFEIKTLIEQSKQQLALSVNSTLSKLYWQIGKRILEEILENDRTTYGKSVVKNISARLTQTYGKGWSEKHLFHCLHVVETFPDFKKFSIMSRELSWSHIKIIMYTDIAPKRDFYIELCKIEKWSVRVFQERIQSMLYERTSISKKPELTISKDLDLLKNEQKMSPDLVFRDPYVLGFLGLKDTYSEKDLETSIINELQKFIIEIGTDFAFLARQKRITIDGTDYFIDLLFYHRRLKSLVAIELKLGEFEASHKGQMELYLRYLEKYEQVQGENQPIGLILCTGKNEEHVELMQLNRSNIRVAEYITLLPSQELLKQKLNQALQLAKSRLENNKKEHEKGSF